MHIFEVYKSFVMPVTLQANAAIWKYIKEAGDCIRNTSFSQQYKNFMMNLLLHCNGFNGMVNWIVLLLVIYIEIHPLVIVMLCIQCILDFY